MRENILSKVYCGLDILDYPNIKQKLINDMINIESVYSYIIYAKYDDNNQLDGWTIQLNISQNDKFNTISRNEVIDKSVDIISNYINNTDKLNYVIGYGQPSIGLILSLFDPMVRKMAKIQHDKWNSLDFEDLCQDCRYIIIDLYNKGYYIHKRLVNKCFINNTIQQLKKERGITFVSFDDNIKNEKGERDLTLKDVIADTKDINDKKDAEMNESYEHIFEEIKKFIVDKYGERVFDQLLRSYSTNTTDNYMRVLLSKIKAELNSSGLLKELKDKYL